jgi:hypothetical protein
MWRPEYRSARSTPLRARVAPTSLESGADVKANLANLSITAAQALAVVPGSNLQLLDSPRSLLIQGNFTYGSGGTTVNAYVQTSLDGGLTWTDIAQFSFATASGRFLYNLNSQTTHATQVTPTNGALTANTAVDGVLGPLYQVQVVTTGTYAATTLRIDVSASDR